ncbi:MAG: HdeD family acid-resistance protein [Methyloceanibacter sp.]
MATAASGKVGIFTYDAARSDALSEVLAQSWWVVGLRGILGIIFGLICLLTPGIAVQVFVILFAAYMLVDGLFAIISGVRAARNGERWGLLVLEGVVDLAAGAVAVLWPAITLVALIWVIAIWAIVSGALMLAAAFGLNLDHGRWWLALGGIASIIFGVLLVIEPLIGAVVLTMWIGAYAIVFGVMLLVLAFQLHSKREAQVRKAPAAAKKA